MNSEVPSPKDLGNASLSVAGVAQSPHPVDTILAPDNVRQFYDAALEMQDLSKQYLYQILHQVQTGTFHIFQTGDPPICGIFIIKYAISASNWSQHLQQLWIQNG